MGTLSSGAKLLMVALLGVMGWALYAYVLQLTYGLGVTGLDRRVLWGVYIVSFVFFIGVSAGGIAVASLSHLAGIAKYKAVGRIAEMVAIISLILAMISIIVDLGRPEYSLNLLLYARPLSPLVWDVVVINTYLVLCLALLWASLKEKPKAAKVLAYISIPAFIVVHSVTAWIFGLMKSQPGWHTAILAPLFICSALVSGLALVILAIVFSKWAFNIHIADDVVVDLGKYLKVLLPVLLYLLFCEFLTISYAGIPSDTAVLNELVSGRFASVFWFDMILGIIVPFVLLVLGFGRTVTGISIIATLSFLGVLAERVNIILPSLYHPFLGSSEISYSPTWIEWSLVGGAYAFGVVLFTVSGLIIPFVPLEEQADRAPRNADAVAL